LIVVGIALLAAWICFRDFDVAKPTVSSSPPRSTPPSDRGVDVDSSSPPTNPDSSDDGSRGFPADLEELQKRLAGLNSTDSSALILRWLGTGRDSATGLQFSLSPDGGLATAPTLRTFLLDQLQRIDSKAAGDYAKEIFAVSDSPDEWALSLRAHARARPDDLEFLKEKSRELIRNKSWRIQPSVGYLEAFDVVVFNHDVELAPELAELVRDRGNRAVTHAAYLTMDRLVQSDTAEMLSRLEGNPEWMAGREGTRADFFSRANVGDDSQRSLVEDYLLNPARSPAELRQFAGVFPNANFRVSRNLLTDSFTPDGAALSTRDRESLRVVQEWLADPRFAGRRGDLETIRQRLELFVGRAGGGSR
jgi:hypothetical protein